MKMAFKVIAMVVALFAIGIVYLHENHRDKFIALSDFPVLRRSLGVIHKLVLDISHSLSFNEHLRHTDRRERLFTVEEISQFDGKDGSPGIYLAILGKVYDVSKGRKHYGPGGSYHAFAGRDASRAFVTGDFSENGLTDDVKGLKPEDLKSIQEWSLFYNKEYSYKGKLIGRYYTLKGERTEYHKEVDEQIGIAIEQNEAQNAEYLKYPPCNAEWTPETGSKVWCSTRSGGIEREWVGVPRKYYKPGSDSYRCACVNVQEVTEQFPSNQRNGNLREYEGCSPESHSCFVRT